METNQHTLSRPEKSGSFHHQRRKLHHWIRRYGQDFSLLRTNPEGMIGVIIILFFAILGLSHPLLMSTLWNPTIYDPHIGYDPEAAPHPSLPSARHILGTDYQGRDVLSLLAFSTRTSFGVGITAAVIGTVIATTVGVTSAYFGGRVDKFMMTLTDVFILLPPAVVMITVGMILDMSWLQAGIIYGIFAGLGAFPLMIRVQTLKIMTKPYTDAARIAGGGHLRLMRLHILPNLSSLIVVNMMFIVTGSVMIEALLAYMDKSQRMSWGTMIWQTQENFRGGAVGLQWHVIIPPAIAIMLFCGAFYLMARTLDQVVNPELRPR
jgi:peptide/nickel transport system permease protein